MTNLVARLRAAAAYRIARWATAPGVTVALGEPAFRLLRMRHRARMPFNEPCRVLIIRLDEIGDFVLTTPFLREFRRSWPNARISLLVKPGVYSLAEHCPHVNEVFAVDTLCSSGQALDSPSVRLRRHRNALAFCREALWPRRLDLAIVPRPGPDDYYAGHIAYLSGATRRVAFESAVATRTGQARLYTDLVAPDPSAHEAANSLALIRHLGGTVTDEEPELWVTEADIAFARSFLAAHGTPGRPPLIALGPSGGRSLLKQWPSERYAEVARALVRKHHARILIIGGTEDVALAERLGHALGDAAVSAAGAATLRQTAALLGECDLYIGNDSGPMHMAAAMRCPVIGIFGSSCHHRFGPWGRGHEVVASHPSCSPCHGTPHTDRCITCGHERPLCLDQISVERVYEAACRMLSSRRGSVAPRNAA